MIHLFLPLRRRQKNSHALWASPDKFKQLTQSVRSFPFLPSSALWNVYPVECLTREMRSIFHWGETIQLGRSLFLRGQQKEERCFLCDLRASSDPGS